MITRLIPTNEVQTAILKALLADTALRDLTPRIYPPQARNSPKRPFVLEGVPITTPRHVDGGDCADVSMAIHCFVDTIEGEISDPRAYANNINAHVARILNDLDVEIGDGMTMKVYVQQAQVMQDGSPSSWHGFVTVRAEAS